MYLNKGLRGKPAQPFFPPIPSVIFFLSAQLDAGTRKVLTSLSERPSVFAGLSSAIRAQVLHQVAEIRDFLFSRAHRKAAR